VYGAAPEPFEHASYVVLRVTRDAPASPDWLIDQRAATLLSEIEHGKRRLRPEVAQRLWLALLVGADGGAANAPAA
jgi:hypothetical protein